MTKQMTIVVTGALRVKVIYNYRLTFKLSLTFTSLWANSADDKLVIFYKKTGLDTSCKLSPLETICMKYQILFSGKKIRKYFKLSSAETFTQRAKH